ncbi:hypothetical protein ACOSP7_025513 [Xanthoceras sorbifolium]|uniref:C2H2-type domain-containing protein n=1 Tax=Xanthoceras sorbifolium TaxID=99658 RepID=A0ABQ8H6S9_9ROSI|nr:hypothetical protein JRO89_XS13G0057200 [Xanthoceras sorbifolium]
MEKHKCKLCPRTFSNGRALGGHMKAHLASLPLPPKTTQQQLVDSIESASSSSSSSGEEQEQLGDKSTEFAEEKSLAYGLRNNPKKSFRIADPEFSFAGDSGSVVQDRESETESKNPTRRRSKRSRKVFVVAHQDQKQNLEIKQPKLKKPSCVESPPTEPEPVSSVSDTSPEEDVAMCLMMLSRDVWMRNKEEEEDQVNGKERERLVEMLEESAEIKLTKIRGKHRCDKCRKVFRSYQALSGHKKVCEVAETRNAGKVIIVADEKIFECPFCFRVFGSGQALGGHKRSHLLASSSTAAANPIKFENNLIDLNLPAPLEEDDYSVVSDA